MNKVIEKQAIEEMAKAIERTEQIARDAHCGLPSPTMYAEYLYWNGYRKQSEGEWYDKGSLSCRCSMCGGKSNKESRFCPNCGVKMKGNLS